MATIFDKLLAKLKEEKQFSRNIHFMIIMKKR